MSMIDALMLAHYNPLHLSYQGIGDMPIAIILLIIDGLTQGVLFISAQAYAKHDYSACGMAYLRSLRQALILCLFLIPLTFLGPDFLSLFKYDAITAQVSGTVLQILSFSIVFSAIYMVSQFFLTAIKKPQISMRFVVIANIINIGLNWLLMGGNLGFPELGVLGVVISTTVVRIFLGVGLVTYIFTRSEFKKYLLSLRHLILVSNNWQQMKLGVSATLNILSDHSSYMFCLIFISTMSVFDVAAYSLSYRFMAIVGMFSISFAVAGTVFTSEAFEKKQPGLARQSIFAALNLNNAIIGTISILALLFAKNFVRLLSNDYLLRQQTLPLIKIMCAVILFNGIQNILIINLRSLHDLLIPTLYKILFYPITIPLFAYLLTRIYSLGTAGVVLAILIGNSLSATTLFIRFIYLNQSSKKTQ